MQLIALDRNIANLRSASHVYVANALRISCQRHYGNRNRRNCEPVRDKRALRLAGAAATSWCRLTHQNPQVRAAHRVHSASWRDSRWRDAGTGAGSFAPTAHPTTCERRNSYVPPCHSIVVGSLWRSESCPRLQPRVPAAAREWSHGRPLINPATHRDSHAQSNGSISRSAPAVLAMPSGPRIVQVCRCPLPYRTCLKVAIAYQHDHYSSR
jgi:hypothetical protein